MAEPLRRADSTRAFSPPIFSVRILTGPEGAVETALFGVLSVSQPGQKGWKPLFALVPVESLIRDQQAGYYAALNAANQAGESTPFIAFMLEVIRDALAEMAHGSDQVTDQVSDQVAALLSALGTQTLSAVELMRRLDLKHRPSFRQRYLQPAIDAKLIEMTRPDAPRSSVQRYRRALLTRRTRRTARSTQAVR